MDKNWMRVLRALSRTTWRTTRWTWRHYRALPGRWQAGIAVAVGVLAVIGSVTSEPETKVAVADRAAPTSTTTTERLSAAPPTTTTTAAPTTTTTEPTTTTAAPTTTTTAAPRTTTTAAPRRTSTTAAAKTATGKCHASYTRTCIPPDVSDADCAGGSGDGPYYVREKNIGVVGPDEYGLDADGDGLGCER